ncbi:alkaline ceramidase [Parapedobacter pyrenivorans]|uniref:Alkaline ceramidase n=1 Tax=Parapedobacter pyrenivorans TaxID=1305674 RepID=A0A917MFE8_9SPHI|nr:hypothetical protein [Parapedobacter pyrenivorans]GGH03807.1 alkaline ceramidase [Parapedobacter pyrenivorans]
MNILQNQEINNTAFSGLIGVARREINPPLGIYARNWGAGRTDNAVGFHRPLTLTCLTFQSQNAEQPLVLIGADLGWWSNALDELKFRRGILDTLNLEESRLMVCLSHTHAGPCLSTAAASKPGGQWIEPYLLQLKEKSVDAIREALQHATLSTLEWRYGTCDLATNRDLQMEAEKRVVVGFNPQGEADHTLLIGRVTDVEGNITATIVNYACHPTTLAWDNELLSPDYIGAMRELVENQAGGRVLFLQGASGELAPAEQYVGDVEVADAHGRRLGYAVLATLEAMSGQNEVLDYSHTRESGAPLAVWNKRRIVPSSQTAAKLVMVPFQLKDLASLADIEAQWLACDDPVVKERLWRKRWIRMAVGDGDIAPMPLWIWQIGNACLVGQPNEAYSRYQQRIRAACAPIPVAAINIVNGYAGYLPPVELYGKDMYAVWQTPFAAGALEDLEIKTIETLNQLFK